MYFAYDVLDAEIRGEKKVHALEETTFFFPEGNVSEWVHCEHHDNSWAEGCGSLGTRQETQGSLC